MNRLFTSALCGALIFLSFALASAAEREPYGIGLEGFAYPYPVNLLPLVNDGEQVRMAYMDVAAAQPNGRTVVLLHGRNFPSSYWAPVISTLSKTGYRVVVPDQIGFGKSSKPSVDLHFDTLRVTPSRYSTISGSKRPISSRIRLAACSASASPVPFPTASRIWC